MPLHPELIAILACPLCKEKVRLIHDEAGAETGLQCDKCNRLYPIRDGIPVMLPDEATVDETKGD